MPVLIDYTFFQNALAAVVLTAILCSCVGTYVVTRRMSLVSGGIAHSSLGGVGLGALLGFSPMAGAALFALVSGLAIRTLAKKRNVREDSAIAMVWTFGMSVGIIAAYSAPSFLPELPSFLFGNILTVTHGDIAVLLMLTSATLIFYSVCLPHIVAVAFDYDFAQTQHIRAGLIDIIMTVIVAFTVVACLKVAGIVLVIALLSVPQITANIFAVNFRHMILLSLAISLFDCLAGMAVAFYLNVPCGATIIFVSVLVYLLAKAINSFVCTLRK